MSKIAILNKSGSIGKTSLAAHLFYPRMPKVRFYALEASNITGADFGIKVISYDSTQFKETVRDAFHYDNAIFDIGGSKNYTDFYAQMQETDTGAMNFDYFVVPTIADEKAEKETVDTIIKLLELGVDTEKFRIIYNKVKPLDKFNYIPNLVKEFGLKTTVVKNSPLFSSLLSLGMTINQLQEVEGDAQAWKMKAVTAKKGSAEFEKMYEMYYAKDMVNRVVTGLDQAWAELEIA